MYVLNVLVVKSVADGALNPGSVQVDVIESFADVSDALPNPRVCGVSIVDTSVRFVLLEFDSVSTNLHRLSVCS